MIFLHTLKLTIANYYISWRVTLYKVLAAIICIALGISIIVPGLGDINRAFSDEGVWAAFGQFFTSSNGNFVASIVELYNKGLYKGMSIISEHASGLPIRIVGLVLLMCLAKFLSSLSDLSVTQSVDGYMSSLQEEPFLNGFFRTLKTSIRYAVFNCITVVFDIFVGIAAFTILGLITKWQTMFIPFLTIVFLCVMYSFKKTVFACFVPALVRDSEGDVLKAFAESLKSLKTKFFGFWFASFNFFIIAFVFNYIGLYFIGIGLIVTIPATLVAMRAFDLVVYYTINKLKFYVSPTTITQSFRDEIDAVDEDAEN